MTEFKKLEVGNVLSETQYYTVEKIKGNNIQLGMDGGESIIVEKGYVEAFLSSANQFKSTEKKTKTELAELFINSPRIAMTVCFFKQDKPKTKKKYKEELAAQAEVVKNDFLNNGISAIETALANPIKDYTPGELRAMIGRHYGVVDDLGRVTFVDMEIKSGMNTRQVDPRTIQYIIVDDVKYELK